MIHTTGHSEPDVGNSPTSPETEAPVEPSFPLEALPDGIREMAVEVARVLQLPQELPATMALATVSAALGQSVFLDNPPHRTPPNVFALTPAQSGTGKSEAFRLIVSPLHELQARLIEAFAEIGDGLEAERQLLEAEARGLKSGKGKQTPAERRDRLTAINRRLREIVTEGAPPRLLVEDVTGPQLAAMLAARGETLALFSSEAGEVVSNISGRHNATGRTDETLMLKGYSLEPHAQDRVGTGATVLKKPCLAVLLVCTPDEASNLFSIQRFAEGGLLPRFLVCFPETRWQHDDGSERRPNAEILRRWQWLVVGLAETFRMRRTDPDTVRATPEALALLREFHNDYASRFDELQEIAAFAARHKEHAARLALILHCVKHGKQASATDLARDTMRDAIALVQFYAGEQRKMLERGLMAEREGRLGELLELLMRRYPTGATLRDLKKSHGWQESEIRRLADLFPERLSVVEMQNPAGGRRSYIVSAL